jgi:hypothetical protein
MSDRNQTLLMFAAVMLTTVTLGFFSWWTFVPVAFAAAFYFTRSQKVLRPLIPAMLAPALGWVVTAFVRDLFEDGRISAKLATLLHIRFAIAVYLVLFVVALIPSSLAAYSGSQASKALR